MDSAKQQLADRLKSSNNILVTVSRDPSVDQLAALLGLTLLLNKQGKHGIAVFSGEVPSTIEFLKPEETIEKNTDSLRDFIIALDKNKADKLRYKVENDVVRIFITPYKTSISQEDLEFSQGDFNVDVVVALGVKQQQDLDEAITAHGRILHDATVASINNHEDSGLGSIVWKDPTASSLSELVTDLAGLLGENVLDNQIATALLTGIVAETERFSNDKTTSLTMTASSVLMAAGANQQLVASKLEEPPAPKPEEQTGDKDSEEQGDKPDNGEGDDEKEEPKNDDGSLNIEHDKNEEKKDDEQDADNSSDSDADDSSSAGDSSDDQVDETPTSDSNEEKPATELPSPVLTPEAPVAGSDTSQQSSQPDQPAQLVSDGSSIVTEPPKLGGTLTANSRPEALDPVTDPLSMPAVEQPTILSRPAEPAAPVFAPPQDFVPPQAPAAPVPAPQNPIMSVNNASPLPPPLSEPASPAPPAAPAPFNKPDVPQTLSQIEQSVNSPHAELPKLDDARSEIDQALAGGPATPAPPIAALNAQPLGEDLHPSAPLPPPPQVDILGPAAPTPIDVNPPAVPVSLNPTPQVTDPTAPPTVPPPFMPAATTPPTQSGSPL